MLLSLVMQLSCWLPQRGAGFSLPFKEKIYATSRNPAMVTGTEVTGSSAKFGQMSGADKPLQASASTNNVRPGTTLAGGVGQATQRISWYLTGAAVQTPHRDRSASQTQPLLPTAVLGHGVTHLQRWAGQYQPAPSQHPGVQCGEAAPRTPCSSGALSVWGFSSKQALFCSKPRLDPCPVLSADSAALLTPALLLCPSSN